MFKLLMVSCGPLLARRLSRRSIRWVICLLRPGEWNLCRPEGIACFAAVCKISRNVFSNFGEEVWEGLGSARCENFISVSSVYLVQLAFSKLMKVFRGE